MSTLSERVQTRIAELEAKQAEVGTELNAIATDPKFLLTDAEMALGPAAWAAMDDPLQLLPQALKLAMAQGRIADSC
jgi:hypothetical protein